MNTHSGAKSRHKDDISPHIGTAPLILLVDDDRAVRHSLALMLRASGFQVASFASATDILAAALPQDYDILLADYVMPGMDGLALVGRLRDAGWHGPALLITGRYDANLPARAEQAGIARVLEKPLDKADLLAAIAAVNGSGATEVRGG